MLISNHWDKQNCPFFSHQMSVCTQPIISSSREFVSLRDILVINFINILKLICLGLFADWKGFAYESGSRSWCDCCSFFDGSAWVSSKTSWESRGFCFWSCEEGSTQIWQRGWVCSPLPFVFPVFFCYCKIFVFLDGKFLIGQRSYFL